MYRRKPILHFEELYEIDTEGIVWSLPKFRLTLDNDKILPLKGGCNIGGYRMVSLVKNGKRTTKFVHRLVGQAFLNLQPEQVINHLNGITDDNRLINLQACTQKENILHSIETGLTQQKGQNNGNSKLFDYQWKQIKDLYKTGLYTQLELGKMYGISQAHVSKVIRFNIGHSGHY